MSYFMTFDDILMIQKLTFCCSTSNRLKARVVATIGYGGRLGEPHGCAIHVDIET